MAARRDSPLPWEDLHRLFAAALGDPRDSAIFSLMLWVGLKPQQLIGTPTTPPLKLTDFDFEKATLTVPWPPFDRPPRLIRLGHGLTFNALENYRWSLDGRRAVGRPTTRRRLPDDALFPLTGTGLFEAVRRWADRARILTTHPDISPMALVHSHRFYIIEPDTRKPYAWRTVDDAETWIYNRARGAPLIYAGGNTET